MCIKTIYHLIAQELRQTSLGTILIILFVVPIAAMVGSMGYLTFSNGQAVNDVASQLAHEISDRVQPSLAPESATSHLSPISLPNRPTIQPDPVNSNIINFIGNSSSYLTLANTNKFFQPNAINTRTTISLCLGLFMTTIGIIILITRWLRKSTSQSFSKFQDNNRAKDLFESIFNESADAIFIVNAETLVISDCNRRAVELFEAQSKQELINTEGHLLQKKRFTTGQLRSIANQVKRYGFWQQELEYVSKKGNVFWGNLAIRQIDVAGQPMHLVRVTDITPRKQAEAALRIRQRQDAAIAQLGQEALIEEDLSILMEWTVTRVAQTLNVDYCQILQRLPNGEELLLVAGFGWQAGLVGQATVSSGKESQFGYSLVCWEPIIVTDLPTETRFQGSPLLQDHGVVSGMSTRIPGQNQPFGVLAVHTTQKRQFTDDDIYFMQAIANIIATAIERKRTEEALRESAVRERAIATVLQRMRQTLDIDKIFTATTEELRHVLRCDRVAIYRFNPDWSGEFVAESVADGWVTLTLEQQNNPDLKADALEEERCTLKTLDGSENISISSFHPQLYPPYSCPNPNITNLQSDNSLQDTYLKETQGGAYSQGASYRVVEDIYNAGFTDCYIELLEQFQARSYIIAPIFCGKKLWGLLATYQNSSPRAWRKSEISVVVQIATQFGVAVQQAQLLQKTQEQALDLELTLNQLKRTQAQLVHSEKMSSLGQMVAGVAHEINNPVSFIYGNLTPAKEYVQDLVRLIQTYQKTYPTPTAELQQLIEEIDLDFLLDDWQNLLKSMQIGTDRIRAIVLSLRNFSRLDEKEIKKVDIHEGIDNTLLILQHRFKAAGNTQEIQVIKHYAQLPLVTCYASQLNQVFMNILNNAIDALEDQPSPRIITISTEVDTGSKQPTTDDGQPTSDFIIIRIADNGSGINEDIKPKIFDPFFTTKPVGSGTGLGLSISHQIVVEKHQGQIYCTSTLGQGTEFIVKIPL
ncbi:MAG: GAF domain-containing protein [Coleofasciculus sp. B1-GNL1-01]|uniref:GAF domain-containing sensor histidine kinase n=1 Tax=Coleofasciculus sp. B1-GNL1-01 TaxID=3068484 RepID=UPI0032F5017B